MALETLYNYFMHYICRETTKKCKHVENINYWIKTHEVVESNCLDVPTRDIAIVSAVACQLIIIEIMSDYCQATI